MTALTQPSQGPAAIRVLKQALKSREVAVAIVLVLLIAVTTLKSDAFLFSETGWRNLLLTPSMLVLLAVGQTAVIITRNVDLSVGSTMGLTAYLTGRLFIDTELPIIAVVACAILMGAALGAVNGILIAWGRVPALVITLGTMYIYRGAFLSWAGSDRINADDLPAAFSDLGTESILGIPVLTIVALVVLVAVGYYLYTARGGREFYAIGSDPDAAQLYGLKASNRIFSAFVLSGALAGLAGAVSAARFGTVSSSVGTGIEFEAVGAAVIGGVAIFGGSGTVWGAALGAFLLVTINRALPVLGISDFWQQAVVGALIVGAIALDRVLVLRQEKALVAARDHEPSHHGSTAPTLEPVVPAGVSPGTPPHDTTKTPGSDPQETSR